MSAAGVIAVMALGAAAPSPYFPPSLSTPSFTCEGSDVAQPILGDFKASWYSSQLSAAAEPSLLDESQRVSSGPERAVRFTWLRSFHVPVVVRVVWDADGDAALIAKELSGKGGYDPGTVARSVRRRLSRAESEAVVAAFLAADSVPKEHCNIFVDGAEWIVEGADRRGYHFVARTSPERGPIRAFGLIMLNLTGWRYGEVY